MLSKIEYKKFLNTTLTNKYRHLQKGHKKKKIYNNKYIFNLNLSFYQQEKIRVN